METFSNCALNKGGREKCVFFQRKTYPISETVKDWAKIKLTIND